MTTASAIITALFFFMLASFRITDGYSSFQRPIRKSPQVSASSSSQLLAANNHNDNNINRSAFLSIASTSSSRILPLAALPFFFFASSSTLVVSFPTPANAKDIDPASLKGTKSDPAFQACLGRCIYDCTKPKGSEQRSRAECLPECKRKCATSKEQLMTGAPLKKA